ncbi:zinc ribbon domain-containing protein [Halobiforma nitratireducens]|uniref:Uncharacterized protein n=1 Tax=Halobiforma nitratireducens JCM 10879 TaxID=1227454 RepID=M0MHQ3_9EURY|nr:hypothetical protein [Halobiforma nitratireducens]EMA45231.1 hypothetical protein C446_02457 [Halobiforma nitratireducens JCM 10879]
MSTDNRQTVVDYATSDQQKRDYWDRESELEELIERCSRATARGKPKHYGYAATTLAEDIIPLLEDHTGVDPIHRYSSHLSDHEDWHYTDLVEFYDRHETIAACFGDAYADLPPHTIDRAEGVVERTLRSITAIAEHEDIVMDSYQGRADGTGFEVKLGEHLQDGRMDLGDPVELVTDEQVDAVKWLVCGGTGMGKSTGTERFAEDYLAASHAEGRDYKILDILGMRQGENWLVDLPQQQDDLRRIREEQGLEPSFAEADDREPPQVEILHPMTRGFCEKSLPFDPDDEQFRVRPFTVPASEFRKPVMVSLIMSRLSESEEATIREVYDEVDEAKDDWSLKDIAEAILERDELSDKHKSKAVGVLRSLQNEGFIRTHADEHTLDWHDVMQSTETYTIFSQALCDRDLSALMTFAYVLDRCFRHREGSNYNSEAVLVMRELWEVVPHKRRRSFDAREAAVQEAIGQIAMKVMRQNRHAGIHIVADTQEPSDLLKSVRELFNHYVVYSANRDTIDDIFEWTQNNRTRSFWSTMTAQAGQAGIVGQAKPALENRDIEFVSPVEVTPPSHHHFDVKTDGTGWHARAKYFTPTETCSECGHDVLERSADGYMVTCSECGHEELDASGGRTETLRRPADVDGVTWDDSVPSDLEVPTLGDKLEVDEDSGPDPEAFPVKAFAEYCLTRKSGTNTVKQEVYEAFNAFAQDYGHDPWDFDDQSVSIRFGKKLKKRMDGPVESAPNGDGDMVFYDIALTDEGEYYLDGFDGLSDAGKPIAGSQ